MKTTITNDIQICVETMYQSAHSKPLDRDYVHAYRITIKNLGRTTVQLLRRHWFIQDSISALREVKGDGVIGVQPILKPNESHQYVSGCYLKSDMGKMYGTYTMKNVSTGDLFNVTIPTFYLIASFKHN